jgi:adenylate cyclase
MRKAPTITRQRLAAIFCADVAGYSSLMRSDEAATMRLLTSHREITDRLIAQHDGRIANTAGDSILAEFPSAVYALRCALAIQEQIASVNEWIPQSRRVTFRIGLHVGEALERDGDLFGDDVNIAARMQALARPGSVCVSGTAYGYVRKTLSATVEDLGPQRIKNIETPIQAFMVHAPIESTARAFPPVHRMEFYLARRFQAICVGAMREITQTEGLEPIDTAALASINELPGIDEPQLAQRLGIGIARVRRILVRLERRTFVGRGPGRDDRRSGGRRSGGLRLTAEGLIAFRTQAPRIRAAVERVMAPLSSEERETLKELLARVVKAHEAGTRPAKRRRPPAAG